MTGNKKSAYPGHIVYDLNDGNVIPGPAFGVGSALYQKNATGDVLLALQNGYRHIDNARIYGNEASVGDAIKLWGGKREDLYITTKYDAIDGDDVKTEFEKSIKDLGVDYLDLYLIHFPKYADAGGGIAKVWKAFEELKKEGLVRSIGVSNYGIEEMSELLALAEIPPAVNQIKYHSYSAVPFAPLLALQATKGIITEAYSSLTPITRLPGGPADAVGKEIAGRLSSTYGSTVEVSQMILDWLKAKTIVAVTTSSKSSRQLEVLDVYKSDFPPLTAEEIVKYDTAAPGWGSVRK